MSARPPSRPGRLLWLALALCGSPALGGVALADCGHRAPSASRYLEAGLLFFTLDDQPRADAGPLTPPGRGPLPCTGPGCSQRRVDPPMTVPVPDRPGPERGLVPPETQSPSIGSKRSMVSRNLLAHSPPELDRPERPPRP